MQKNKVIRSKKMKDLTVSFFRTNWSWKVLESEFGVQKCTEKTYFIYCWQKSSSGQEILNRYFKEMKNSLKID